MGNATAEKNWNGWHFAALLGGNAALALGPLWVRLADSGPVSAGFWRLFLAIPVFVLLARWNGQRLTGHSRAAILAILGAGLFFSMDLASWHLGIERTRLGNATLFGNSGSILLVAFGLIALRRAPRALEWAAFAAAIVGSAILLGRSLEIGHETLVGDLLCLLAGFLYTFYILLAQRARADLGGWTVLVYASLAGLPVLLGTALVLGEPVWPTDWTPIIALAFTSQVVGQGLLVYALRHFSAFIVGLALMTQPALAVLVGWMVFDEVLGAVDLIGMALVGAGLVLARSTQQ
ncbi:MAG: DMT family transporter [Sphingomonadales bacterium]|nr:DMT family transporter [Sphingomonadales bacterium]